MKKFISEVKDIAAILGVTSFLLLSAGAGVATVMSWKAAAATNRNYQLDWDDTGQGATYRIYSNSPLLNWQLKGFSAPAVQLGSSTSNSFIQPLPQGRHLLSITAVRSNIESVPAYLLVTNLQPPSIPRNLRVSP